jgi:hypothetical protein
MACCIIDGGQRCEAVMSDLDQRSDQSTPLGVDRNGLVFGVDAVGRVFGDVEACVTPQIGENLAAELLRGPEEDARMHRPFHTAKES